MRVWAFMLALVLTALPAFAVGGGGFIGGGGGGNGSGGVLPPGIVPGTQVATLGPDGRINPDQLPFTVVELKGTWDADQNETSGGGSLASGVGQNGDAYIVSVAGTTELDGIDAWSAHDVAVFVGATSTWERLGASGTTTGIAGGDLSGSYPSPTLAAIMGRTIDSRSPSDGQVYIWDNTQSLWIVGNVVHSVAGLNGVVTADQLADVLRHHINPPAVRNFHIDHAARVDPDTVIGNTNVNCRYDVSNAASLASLRIVGQLNSVSPVVLQATASKTEGGNLQAVTIPAGITLQDGDTYTIKVEGFAMGQTPGVDTPETSATQAIYAQSAPVATLLYWGTHADSTITATDVSTLQNSQTRLDGEVRLPTWTDSQHIVFAYPASASPVSAVMLGGINQLPAFTLTENAVTLNSVSYNLLVSDNLIDGAVASGSLVTIVR